MIDQEMNAAEVKKFGDEAAQMLADLRRQVQEERDERLRQERINSRVISDVAMVTEILGVPEEESYRPITELVQEFLQKHTPSSLDIDGPLIDEEKERDAFAHFFRLEFPVGHFDLRNIEQKMCKVWLGAKKQAALQQRNSANPVGEISVSRDASPELTLNHLGNALPEGRYPLYLTMPDINGTLPVDAWQALTDARAVAMDYTMKARVPECGEFGGIAQNLDFAINTLADLMKDAPESPVPPGCVRVTKELADHAFELQQDVAADIQEGGSARLTWEPAVIAAWQSVTNIAPESEPAGVDDE